MTLSVYMYVQNTYLIYSDYDIGLLQLFCTRMHDNDREKAEVR